MPSLSALFGVAAATLSVASATQYTVQDTYAGSSFFDNFNFGTEEKTNGFVKYVDRKTAQDKGYISFDNGDAVFGVDYKSKLNYKDGGDVGRESVRLEGKKEYNKGLFVLDIKHMPGGICGTWPSFWALGREPWPVKGEIDIIEGVNKNSVNSFVLHTDTQCKTDGRGQSGVQAGTDCAYDTAGSTGCGVTDTSSNSYGTDFNTNQGGYYVTEWQDEGIKIWFFPRGSAPKSLTSGSPDTSEFGIPNANFQGDCDIKKRFMDQRFIFTNTFCGDWGGNVYAQSGCQMYDGLDGMASCKRYVAENPEVFKEAYWRISSFKTYNKRTITSSSSIAPSSTPHASSSSVHVSSSSAHVSSSSVHVSSSSVAHSSSVQSSSVVHSSATPTPHGSSSAQPSSTPATSASHPHDVSSSVVHDYSSTIAVPASETPYDHVSSSSIGVDYSSTLSSSASETPYSHDVSSTISSSSVSETPYDHVSSSSVGVDYSSTLSSSASETPYSHDVSSTLSSSFASETPCTSDSSSIYPSVSSSHPVDGKSSSSTPVYSTSAPIYSVYPEGDGYGYNGVSSKTPDASSKVPEYDAYPTASTKTPEYDSYPVASSSTPVYGNDYPSHPSSSSKPVHNHYTVSTPGVKSTPVYTDYPELPSFTPLYSTYPAVSSKPSYGDDKKSTDSYKTTTAYETTYVDVCPTGYTTITTKVTAIQTPGPKPTTDAYYAPPGFEVTTKYCAQGCGEGPKTVTVTVPCSKCQATTLVPNKPTDVPSKPTGNTPYTPAQPSKPATPYDSTTKVTATKIVTLTKVPVPESQYYATHSSVASASASLIKYPDSDSGKSYANSKPVAPTGSAGGSNPVYPTGSAPASKPVAPTGSVGGGKPVYPTGGVPGTVGYPGSNVTISYETATSAKGKPTQTAYKVPEFTGAASSFQVGGAVAGAIAAFAAMMM